MSLNRWGHTNPEQPVMAAIELSIVAARLQFQPLNALLKPLNNAP